MSEDIEGLKKSINEKIDAIKESSNPQSHQKIEKLIEVLNEGELDGEKYEKIDKGLSIYQRFLNAFETDVDIDPGRLMGLTDGIFGMVMTLLVFGIAIPGLEITSYSQFLSFFTSLAPTVGITIVSFVLISSFWIYHHEFIKVKTLNFPYLWLNIFFLICISFIPFTTSLIGNYSMFFLSNAIFGLNIFLTLLFFFLMFYYAYHRGFLEKMPSKSERKYIFNTLIILMAFTLIVNLLDFNVSGNFIYLFLLVPVISTIRDIRFKMKS